MPSEKMLKIFQTSLPLPQLVGPIHSEHVSVAFGLAYEMYYPNLQEALQGSPAFPFLSCHRHMQYSLPCHHLYLFLAPIINPNVFQAYTPQMSDIPTQTGKSKADSGKVTDRWIGDRQDTKSLGRCGSSWKSLLLNSLRSSQAKWLHWAPSQSLSIPTTLCT